MIDLLLWLLYLFILIRIWNASCLVAADGLVSVIWCRVVQTWVGDEDRILMESLYVFKGYGAKILIKELKVEDCGD